MSGNFTYGSIRFAGKPAEVRELARKYLDDEKFRFDKVLPVPPPLDFEHTNLIQTGYDALYGDWRAVARQWMLKSCAEEAGLSFPLESRADVVMCLQKIDQKGDYLAPAERFSRNLEAYGFGSREDWRKKHWGTDDDIITASLSHTDQSVEVRTVSNSFPVPLLLKLSEEFPGMEIEASYVDDRKRTARKLHIRNARKQQEEKVDPKHVAAQLGLK